MRVEGDGAARRGHGRRRRPSRRYLFARRRGDVMEVVVPAQLEGGRFAASLDLAELALPGEQADVWNLRLVAARRSYRLGTHLDGIANRGEATEFPAVRAGGRRLRPYYTVEDNVSVRSEVGGAGGAGAARRPTRRPSRGLARRLLGRPGRARAPAGAAARRAAPRAAASPTAPTSASSCCTRGGWAARCARR